MAVTWTATGITASSDTTSPFANLSYTLPTGHTTNDLLIAFYGGKPYNTVPSTPTDYAPQSGGANGSTAMGAASSPASVTPGLVMRMPVPEMVSG